MVIGRSVRRGTVALVGSVGRDNDRMITSSSASSSAPAGYRFPREVIAVAVRWYLRYGLCYRDVEELLAERGIDIDHVTVRRWVQTFTAEFIDAARPGRHATGDRWFVDETYVAEPPSDPARDRESAWVDPWSSGQPGASEDRGCARQGDARLPARAPLR